MGVLGPLDLEPVGAWVRLTVGLDSARSTSDRDSPASADEFSSTGLEDGGGHDDGEVDVLTPLDLEFGGGLGVDAVTLGEVADLEGDDVGQVVLDEITTNVGDELGRDLGHVNRGRTLSEFEGDDALIAKLEESSVNVGDIELLDGSGLGPSETVAHAGLETNGPDREGAVGVERVDTKDFGHAVVLDDLEESLDVNNVLVLKSGLVANVRKGVVPAKQVSQD